MPETLKEIAFTFPRAMGVISEKIWYVGRDVILPTQWGVTRINVDTGRVITRIGIAYPNPLAMPSSIGVYLIGDHNQSVSQLVANAEWIVTNVEAPIEGQDPIAVVWKNDGIMTFHGFVYRKDGYGWSRKSGARIAGDLLYVPSELQNFDVMNVRSKEWTGAKVTPPAVARQENIDGYTYRVECPSGDAKRFVLMRSDVATTPSEPIPTPTPQPTPEEPTVPPEEPTPTVPDCPPGQKRNFMGICVPEADLEPRPVPVQDETYLDFAERISVQLYVTDSRLGIGKGRGLRLTGGTAAFHFGNPDSLEVIVKVIDGRAVNGHWWIFACGLTDVGCELVATKGDKTKRYPNPQGTAFQPIQDTSAFSA